MQRIQLNEMVPEGETWADDSWIDCGMMPQNLRLSGFGRPEFVKLWNSHPVDHGQVMIFGRVIDVPRWQKTYGKSYAFSGMMHEAEPIPDHLQRYVDFANGLGYPGVFNQLLVNWYKDGSHYIGAHSDDERQLVPGSAIVSISYGQERKFRMRRKVSGPGSNPIIHDMMMPHGTLLVMGGDTQKLFTHEVPKVGGKRGAALEPRINITLRQFVEDEE